MDSTLQLIVNGLALGSVYALVALGFVLINEATGVVNFATGQFVMVGCFFGVTTILNMGMPIWPGYLVALGMMLVFGFAFCMLVYKPLQKASPVSLIIGTVAAGIVIQNAALLVWGSLAFRPQAAFGDHLIGFSGVLLPVQSLFTVAVTLVLIGAVHLLLYRSPFGAKMRAVAQDMEAASLMAIPVSRILVTTWLIAALLMGIAGLLLGPLWFADVAMGDPIALKAFAAAIIGGFGSVTGALVGGLAVGLAEMFLATHITSTFKDALVYLLMIIFLIVRPSGLFGERISERG